MTNTTVDSFTIDDVIICHLATYDFVQSDAGFIERFIVTATYFGGADLVHGCARSLESLNHESSSHESPQKNCEVPRTFLVVSSEQSSSKQVCFEDDEINAIMNQPDAFPAVAFQDEHSFWNVDCRLIIDRTISLTQQRQQQFSRDNNFVSTDKQATNCLPTSLLQANVLLIGCDEEDNEKFAENVQQQRTATRHQRRKVPHEKRNVNQRSSARRKSHRDCRRWYSRRIIC